MSLIAPRDKSKFPPAPILATEVTKHRGPCNHVHEIIVETPLWGQLTFHHFGLIIAAVFCIVAIAVSVFLTLRHATHYLKPYEQKHIIRILAMIPIYVVVSFISYVYYQKAMYFEVIRDCYEAFALASFFTLLCHYVAPNLHEQKEYFRKIHPKNWTWPLNWLQLCCGGGHRGWLRKPRSGLTWFNIMWIGIFQYCVIRTIFTIVAIITESQGLYCENSRNPNDAYSWVAGFQATSVMIAMFCLVQFYKQLKEDLASHRPFLKLFCFKLSVFLCFWQRWVISLLSDQGLLKTTDKIASADLRHGIPCVLTCVEMAVFSIIHLFAFPWKPYDLEHNRKSAPHSTFQMSYAYGPAHALGSAVNPWDIIKACGRGIRWLFVGVHYRKDDPSYERMVEDAEKTVKPTTRSTARKTDPEPAPPTGFRKRIHWDRKTV